MAGAKAKTTKSVSKASTKAKTTKSATKAKESKKVSSSVKFEPETRLKLKPASTKGNDVRSRLSKSAGHLMAIKRMLDEGRDFYDVLIQMSSAEVMIRRIGEEFLKERIKEHILEFPKAKNKEEAFEAISRLLDRAKI